MKRWIVLGIAVLALTAPTVAAARVPIVSCRLQRTLLPPNASNANHIRIHLRARLIDGYLPRCDLATFVAADANGRRRIVEKGARWFVGAFTCSYRYLPVRGRDQIDVRTRCSHSGRYASTVWFDSYA